MKIVSGIEHLRNVDILFISLFSFHHSFHSFHFMAYEEDFSTKTFQQGTYVDRDNIWRSKPYLLCPHSLLHTGGSPWPLLRPLRDPKWWPRRDWEDHSGPARGKQTCQRQTLHGHCDNGWRRQGVWGRVTVRLKKISTKRHSWFWANKHLFYFFIFLCILFYLYLS